MLLCLLQLDPQVLCLYQKLLLCFDQELHNLYFQLFYKLQGVKNHIIFLYHSLLKLLCVQHLEEIKFFCNLLTLTFVHSRNKHKTHCLLFQYIHPSVRPSVHPSVRPSIRPSVHPSVRPPVHPPANQIWTRHPNQI